jgi:hypothetical protein
MFRRHLDIPHEMIVITNELGPFSPEIRVVPLWPELKDAGGCFRRLKIFSKEMKDLIGKRFVSIDLDVVLVDDVTPIFDRDEKFIIWGEHFRKTPYCGSLFMMNAGCYPEIWESFNVKCYPSNHRQMWPYGTDQDHICSCLYPDVPMWTMDDGIHNFNYTIRKWGRFGNMKNWVVASKYHQSKYYSFINRSLGRDSDKMPKEIAQPYMAGDGSLPEGCRMVLFNGKHDPSEEFIQKEYPWVKEHWK